MNAMTVVLRLAAVCVGVAAACVAWAGDGPTPAAVAAALPFDDRLLRLMNEHFCQQTPYLDVAIYDALPEGWPAADRERLPAANPQRRMAIGRHYGLTPPPEGVQEFPLGIVPEVRGDQTVLRVNCLVCHAGELFGHPVVGLGNTRVDLEALMDDLVKVSTARNSDPGPPARAHLFTKRHGISNGATIGSTSPFTLAALYMSTRHPDLTRRQMPESSMQAVEAMLAGPLARRFGADTLVRSLVMFGMQDIDQDAPSWWLTRADARIFCDSLFAKEGRATLLGVAEPWSEAAAITGRLRAAEEFFAHLDQVRLPAGYAELFPNRVDGERAAAGQVLFSRHCTECHGSYAADPSMDDYPGRVVPVDEIGTDPRRARGITPRLREFLAGSWFASAGTVRGADEPAGYRAPYLRRVVFTFPYFHNGSVPTLRHVLFPDERPDRWLIAPEHFDHERIGQRVEALPVEADGPRQPNRRQIFDTSLPGKGNRGHDQMLPPLEPAERTAILEYLKTL